MTYIERYERCRECDHRKSVYGKGMSWLGCGILDNRQYVGTIKTCPLYVKHRKDKRRCGTRDITK